MAEVTNSTSTYDYSMIGSFGSDATKSVNGEMINKIRAAEEKAVIDPITEDIDNIGLEQEKLTELKEKISGFSDIVSYFDIGNKDNVFDQFNFATAGTAVAYDAVDMTSLEEGSTSVDITQLAQKDVFQSDIITGDPTVAKPTGTLMIEIDGEILFGEDTDADDVLDSPLDVSSYTYEELAILINSKEGLTASIEQVGDTSYRLIVKSTDTGTANALNITDGTGELGFFSDMIDVKFTSDSTITSTDAVSGDLEINGITFTNDGTVGKTSYSDLVEQINSHSDFTASIVNNKIEITKTDGSEITIDSNTLNTGITFSAEQRSTNQTQVAQNLQATIDGVEYDTSSNSITTQGSLKITAVETGSSTINISHDTSAITVAAEALATQYNDLVSFINEELYSEESVVDNKDNLRTILNDVKNLLFQNYGADPIEWIEEDAEGNGTPPEYSNVANNDINIFVLGFELDKTGKLTVDTEAFNKIVNGEDENYDFDDLKNTFTGVYENKGLGVQLKEYLDDLDSYEGLLYNYDIDIISRKEELEEEKEEELERLDTKYGTMAEQFSAYSSVIAQMEASFSGLKMMIEQSTSGN